MSQCWQSGGPAWLLEITFLAATTAVIGAIWWIVAWANTPAPPPPTTRGRLARVLLSLPLLIVFVPKFAASATPGLTLLFSSYLIVSLLFGVVASRRARSLADGTELSSGWLIAGRVARVAAPAVTVGSALICIGSLIAAIQLGRPC